MANQDTYHLNRFVTAQKPRYETALAELKSGRKRTHWMWFIFPQIEGLGHSATTKYYSIKSAAEAREYLRHPTLGTRLIECAETLFALEGNSASDIFDPPDDLKFWSSMTLFASLTDPESIFNRVLGKYFGGKRDQNTLAILSHQASASSGSFGR